MRQSRSNRTTRETNISLNFNIDGTGICKSNTGIGFLDHMMEGFCKHGFFDMELTIQGDLEVDGHHTVEDLGIVLGGAIKEALGDKKGITRFGYFILPMDEVLALCAVDISGRPYLKMEIDFPVEKVGSLDTELIKEFFYALSYSAGMNLHLKMLEPGNAHHMIEALFKVFAKALDMACGYDSRIEDVLSTKGSL